MGYICNSCGAYVRCQTSQDRMTIKERSTCRMGLENVKAWFEPEDIQPEYHRGGKL